MLHFWWASEFLWLQPVRWWWSQLGSGECAGEAVLGSRDAIGFVFILLFFSSTLDYVFVQCSLAVLFLKCCFIWVWLNGILRFSRWFLQGIFCKLKGLALLCGEYKGLKEEKETWCCWGRPKENRRVTWKLIWSSTRSRQTGLSKRKGRQT